MTLGKLYTDTEGIAYMYIKRGMWTGYYTVYCFKDNTQHQMHRDFLKPVKKCPWLSETTGYIIRVNTKHGDNMKIGDLVILEYNGVDLEEKDTLKIGIVKQVCKTSEMSKVFWSNKRQLWCLIEHLEVINESRWFGARYTWWRSLHNNKKKEARVSHCIQLTIKCVLGNTHRTFGGDKWIKVTWCK